MLVPQCLFHTFPLLSFSSRALGTAPGSWGTLGFISRPSSNPSSTLPVSQGPQFLFEQLRRQRWSLVQQGFTGKGGKPQTNNSAENLGLPKGEGAAAAAEREFQKVSKERLHGGEGLSAQLCSPGMELQPPERFPGSCSEFLQWSLHCHCCSWGSQCQSDPRGSSLASSSGPMLAVESLNFVTFSLTEMLSLG